MNGHITFYLEKSGGIDECLGLRINGIGAVGINDRCNGLDFLLFFSLHLAVEEFDVSF